MYGTEIAPTYQESIKSLLKRLRRTRRETRAIFTKEKDSMKQDCLEHLLRRIDYHINQLEDKT